MRTKYVQVRGEEANENVLAGMPVEASGDSNAEHACGEKLKAGAAGDPVFEKDSKISEGKGADIDDGGCNEVVPFVL